MLKNRSLKFKMLAGFGVTSFLLLSVGYLNYVFMQKTIEPFVEISNISVPNLVLVQEFTAGVQEGQQQASLALLNKDPEEVKKNASAASEVIKVMAEKMKAYDAIPFSPGEEAIYTPFKEAWLNWVKESAPFFEAASKGEITPANFETWRTFLHDKVVPAHEAADSKLDGLIMFHDKIAEERAHKGISTASLGQNISILIILFGFTVATAIGFFLSTWLVKNLAEVGTYISSSAKEVTDSSQQLSSASQNMANSSSNSAASLEETVASLEELTSIVKTNADHAQEASSLSRKSRESAENGSEEVQKLIGSMKELSQSSKKIEEIIHLIDDIAFQTNLLALNAAVEAARAGEQGKGFAVVAEAVRGLAQRSATAAKDISSLIQSTVEKTVAGASSAEKSGVVLREIVEQVKRVSDLNLEIATASQEQSKGISQISQAMNDLDRSTQGNAASAEEVAASSEEMNAQARQLLEMSERLSMITFGSKAQSTSTPSPSPSRTSTKPTANKIPSFSSKPATAVTKVSKPATPVPVPAHEAGPTTDDEFWNDMPKIKRAS